MLSNLNLYEIGIILLLVAAVVVVLGYIAVAGWRFMNYFKQPLRLGIGKVVRKRENPSERNTDYMTVGSTDITVPINQTIPTEYQLLIEVEGLKPAWFSVPSTLYNQAKVDQVFSVKYKKARLHSYISIVALE